MCIDSAATSLELRLMERAERLHDFVSRKIPPGYQSVLAGDDVLQEVWMAAFRTKAQLAALDADGLDRWLTKVAERKLIDILRLLRRAKRGGGRLPVQALRGSRGSFLGFISQLVGPQRTPSSEGAREEAAQAVQSALQDIPGEYREALALRYLEGESQAQIATRMHKSVSAVNSLLYRGLRMLRTALGSSDRFLSGHHDQALKPETDKRAQAC